MEPFTGFPAGLPTLWLRLSGHDAGFASGIGFTPEIRDRWRAAVASERGAVLADALTTLISERDAEVAGDELATVPKPYAADHPRRDLLRRKSFQVRWLRPLGPEVRYGAFADWCAAELAAAAPTHRWLVEELS